MREITQGFVCLINYMGIFNTLMNAWSAVAADVVSLLEFGMDRIGAFTGFVLKVSKMSALYTVRVFKNNDFVLVVISVGVLVLVVFG